MPRRKGEYSKSRLDREFPHQVILPADRCTGENGAAMDNFCSNLALGPGRHSLFYEDLLWHLLRQCGARRFFPVGGETFYPGARGRSRNWHLLRGRSVDRKR
jgi:hypothetical protein